MRVEGVEKEWTKEENRAAKSSEYLRERLWEEVGMTKTGQYARNSGNEKG